VCESESEDGEIPKQWSNHARKSKLDACAQRRGHKSNAVSRFICKVSLSVVLLWELTLGVTFIFGRVVPSYTHSTYLHACTQDSANAVFIYVA